MASLINYTVDSEGIIDYIFIDGTTDQSHIVYMHPSSIVKEMKCYSVPVTDPNLPVDIKDAWHAKIYLIKISQCNTLIAVERHYDVLGVRPAITRYNTDQWSPVTFQEAMLSYNAPLVFDDSVIDRYRFNSPE